jgi:hypothetical protein
MGAFNTGSILRGGVSAELSALLRGVGEAEIEGTPRFAAWDCRAMTAAVVGRSYAPDLLELCHLVTVAEACGRGREGYERLFWDSGLARPAALRGFIAQRVQRHGWRRQGFAMTEAGVEIGTADSRRFTVNYRRMPYLCALMDFAVAALGFPAVDAVLAPLFAQPGAPASATVAVTANALARGLHAFLKDHLSGQQHQRKFARMVDHLIGRMGPGFDPSDIDDEAVLSFWLANSAAAAEAGCDFKTFESVYRSFLALLPVLDAALRLGGLDGAIPMGKDREAGEIDPELLARSMAEIVEEEWANPLVLLQEPPADRVKFLNGREMADLAALVEPGRAGFRLPLSVMRHEVFGALQRRLTEELRGQADAGRLLTVIEQPVPSDYAAWLERYAQLERHMEKALRASLHALSMTSSATAAVLALDLAPGLDPRRVAARFGVVVAFPGGKAASSEEPDLTALLHEARQAHQSLNRKGFDRDTDHGLREAFEAGIPALQAVLRATTGMCRRLLGMDAAARFPRDRDIFRRHLATLYGDGS